MSGRSVSRSLRYRLGVGGLLTFGGIVVMQHALQPDLTPRTHEVSEYVNGDPGWLMVLGFLSWSVSLAASGALAAAKWRPGQRTSLARSRVFLLRLAAAGIVITASFASQTSAGRLPAGVKLDVGGRLHDIGSGVATLALVAAAVASIANGDGSRVYRRRTATILLLALASDAALLAVGPGVAGIRQRILLGCAAVWQLLALREWERDRVA
jgi:Protein of unknown function (DUF998)